MRIRFDEVQRFIRVCDVTRYLVLFRPGKYDGIFHNIRNFISQNGGITYVICHYYAKIKFDSYNYLPLEKALTFLNVVILTKPIF